MNRRMAACATLLLILFSASAAAGTASANSPGANITPANTLTVPGANITPASNLSASTPSANSPSTNASFPVKAITAVEGNVQSTSVWFAPPPVEKPVLGWIQDGRSRTGPTGIIVKGTVLAGVASGLALFRQGHLGSFHRRGRQL